MRALWLSLCCAACAPAGSPAVAWNGFRFDWAELSHRIAFLESAVGTTFDGAWTATVGLRGGNWTTGELGADTSEFRLSYTAIEGAPLDVEAGATELIVSAQESGTARVTVEAPVPGGRRQAVDVVLAGFEFDTDLPLGDGAPGDYDPADGWTPQALSARIGAVQQIGDIVRFEVSATFLPGPLDRPPMNANAPFARVAATVFFQVVAADGEFTDQPLSAYQYALSDGGPHTEFPPLPGEQRTVEEAVGDAVAIHFVRGFSAVFQRTIGEEGRYLRSLSSRIESVSPGEVVWDVYASHSSIVEEGDLEADHTVDGVLLTVPRGEAEFAVAQGPQDLGPTEVELDVP